MRYLFLLFMLFTFQLNAQVVADDFEGFGTIYSWYGDDCIVDANFLNPYQQGINVSNTVLEYHDIGGQYANVQFDIDTTYDLTMNNSFSLNVYVPSSGLTGSEINQISLKLQDKNIEFPWMTQSEIVKPIVLDQWQTITFDFENDFYINLDSNSLPPIERTDFNRVVIQVNGENNDDEVLAYLDDVLYFDTVSNNPIYDNLVWFDEFDGNGPVDASKWFKQTQLIAGDSWANGELQHYTNRQDNSFLDNGSLKIVAKGETYNDQDVTKDYTSARLNSKFAFQYGRVEVRAKLPSIAGTWPAIWLLGKNINEDGGYWDAAGFGNTSWPLCGEIDIMEPNVAKNQILATWHWDNGSGYQINSNSVPSTNANTSQNWHIYTLEWSEDTMKIYMDDTLVNQMDSVNPFNQEYYILLNVAMGGSLGGDIQPGFNQDAMEIDYVRVYQETPLSVQHFEKNKVSFYPNPVQNKLHIDTHQFANTNTKVQITDLSGRIISKKQYAENGDTLIYNTSALNVGVYFMTLSFDNGINQTFKFIKQ
ncbi:family 16 glycosylhydrolase [Psychroserpens sp.]|jgi:beta-glucanase (GH16 family)|uniref:family 16 glycosylhydrolase n=1 Tax=Psychroserpens sp. TaxID=2020870 RepID=UPI0039E4EE88